MDVNTKKLPIEVQSYDDLIIERQQLEAQGETFEFIKLQGQGNTSYGLLLHNGLETKYKPKSLNDAVKAVKKYLK